MRSRSSLLGTIGLQLNDVMNFVAPFARRGKAGEDDPDHTFPNWNGVTDFEIRFVRAANEGLACRFLHLSIVAHLEASESCDEKYGRMVIQTPETPLRSINE